MGETRNFTRKCREIGGELCVSSAVLCDLLDVSPQTLSEWVTKGMPRAQYGWYPLKAVLAWRGEIRPEGIKDSAVSLQQRKLEVEIALKEAQQELTRLKTDITNGKYLERELVSEEYRRFFVVLKRAMLAIPRRVAGIAGSYIEPVEARRLEKELSDSVNKALSSFADSVVVSDG